MTNKTLDIPGWCTAQEAANYIGINLRTLTVRRSRDLANGKPHATWAKVGNAVIYKRDTLDDYIQEFETR